MILAQPLDDPAISALGRGLECAEVGRGKVAECQRPHGSRARPIGPNRKSLAGHGCLVIAHELFRVRQAMQRPGLESRPAKIETRLAMSIYEAMHVFRRTPH